MASWERMMHDSQDRVFVPINVDASSDNDSFLTLPKGITIVGVVLAYIGTIMWGSNIGLTFIGWLIVLGFLTFICQYLIRYIVFQEKYFYSLWVKSKEFGTPKASKFWSVASFRKTPSGDILVFQDLRVGVIIELERDTIIGREEGNKEKHYDAWSEAYRTAFDYKLSIVQMNIMQPAGRDDRFSEMADIASKAKNSNVRTLLEINTGYMKSISSNVLDDHDYLLIYTHRINKIDVILEQALDTVSNLLNGAYVSARVLTESEIYQLPRENFNVKFFDGVEAQMNVYRGSGIRIKMPFKITQIEFDNGKKITMRPELSSKLDEAIKLLNNEQISYADWNVVDALRGRWSNQYRAATGKELRYDDGEVVCGDTEAADMSNTSNASTKRETAKDSKPEKKKGFLFGKGKKEDKTEKSKSQKAKPTKQRGNKLQTEAQPKAQKGMKHQTPEQQDEDFIIDIVEPEEEGNFEGLSDEDFDNIKF